LSQTGSSLQQGAQQLKDKTQGTFDQARGTIREQVDQRSTQAGEQVGSVADDLRKIGKELRNQEKATPAQFADQGADKLEQVGQYLKGSSGDKILADVEDFARKQPWVVVAGGIAIGFVASRFLKASSNRRYSSQYGWRLPASDTAGTTGEIPTHTTASSEAPVPYGPGAVSDEVPPVSPTVASAGTPAPPIADPAGQ
jgi:ElaB/YqjD/DUF883 family membrane-anchored ribosome-binding protein